MLEQVTSLAERGLHERAVVDGQEIECNVRRWSLDREQLHSRRRAVDAFLQHLELQPPVPGDHDLPVNDAALRHRRLDRIDDLGEVAGEWSFVAAAELDLIAVTEHDAAEAVPLRLVEQALVVLRRIRYTLRRLREHRGQRGHHGEVHGGIAYLLGLYRPNRAPSSYNRCRSSRCAAGWSGGPLTSRSGSPATSSGRIVRHSSSSPRAATTSRMSEGPPSHRRRWYPCATSA